MCAQNFTKHVCILVLTLYYLPRTSPIVYRKQLSSRVITTRYGKVRGVLVEFPNRHLKPVEAFLGLKYADLEKGNMRFMPPKNPKEQWTKIRAAISQRPACPQPLYNDKYYRDGNPSNRTYHGRNITPFVTEQVEDCLTLNLYVPIQQWNDTTPIPVMVFIHGESYETGTGNAYDGSVLSSFGHVIVVTLNYRLGVLGFLTTLDQSAMGNLGLLDITQALLWIQDNIASFYGDPEKITLFGHGHGAALVNLLLLSPFVSEGRRSFFQRAIIQSGSALATWGISFDALWCTERLAINVNCTTYLINSQKLVSCLRRKTVSQLINQSPAAPKYYSCFAPAIDEWTFLPKEIELLIKERKSKFSSVPVIFGVTSNEAYSYLKPEEIYKGLSNFRKSQIIRTYVQNVFRYHRQKIFDVLLHQYTDWTQPLNYFSNRNDILELLSDGQYVTPIVKTANYHSETSDTYLYTFSHASQSEGDSGNTQDPHSIHGDELSYVFGSPLVNGVFPFSSVYTNADKMMSEGIMTLWTNFAKTGNPNLPINQSSVHGGNVDNRFSGLRWPTYNKYTQEYMLISRKPAILHHYKAQKLALWLDLIPKINVDDTSNPNAHLLANSDNQTLFDDYNQLLPFFDEVFPSPPPMPPFSPAMAYRNEHNDFTTNKFPDEIIAAEKIGNNATSFYEAKNDKIIEYANNTTVEKMLHNSVKENNLSIGVHNRILPTPTGERDDSNVDSNESQGDDHRFLAGSLSVTVAVGCTLLFLNALIFAAVYYQRVRIRKLRASIKNIACPFVHNVDGDNDNVILGRRFGKEVKRYCVAESETGSQASAGAQGGITYCRCDDSPSRDLLCVPDASAIDNIKHLRRQSIHDDGSEKTPTCNTFPSKSNTMERSHTSCKYTPVPTLSYSTVQRQTLPHSLLSCRNSDLSSSIRCSNYNSNSQPFINNHIQSHGNTKGKQQSTISSIDSISDANKTGLYQIVNKSALQTSLQESTRTGSIGMMRRVGQTGDCESVSVGKKDDTAV